MSTQQHTIERIHVDISGNDHHRISIAQQQFGYVLKTTGFLTKLETLLDNLANSGKYIELQSIEIEINDFRVSQLQEQLLQKIETSILQKINSSYQKDFKILSNENFERAIYVNFLRFGLLIYPSGRDVTMKLHEDFRQLPNRSVPILESILHEIGKNDTFIWKRVFYILGSLGMIQYCERVFHYNAQFLKNLLNSVVHFSDNEAITNKTKVGELEFWQKLLPMLINDFPQEKLSVNLFYPSQKSNLSPIDFKQSDFTEGNLDKNKMIEIVSDGLSIENAGMVLLWLEFGQLLRKLGYLEGKSFLNEEYQQVAIILFHYIFSGTVEIREETLLLNKIICGWPINEPVNPVFIPDPIASEMADKMLTDFIYEWRKNRKFSVGWFRQTFLEREGSLKKRPDGNWNLEIKQKTEDILINKITVLRYSWMQEMIFVKW
jgi:hypothetical protein